ncbi:MAG: hypothetical protein NVSMB7_09690 [Chitinophagaceae bacterium]
MFTISVLEPAPVTILQHIKTVAIVNRSNASRQARVIDAIDKVLSLEGPSLDKKGALATVNGLADELLKNNRFTVVRTISNANLSNGTPGLFPVPL